MQLRFDVRLDSMQAAFAASANGRYLPALQYIRGLAALGVAYVHAVQLLPGGDASSFFGVIYPLTYLGAAGVDMFFILSGFLMCHLRETYAARSSMHFLLARAVRIVPIYWLYTLFFAALLALAGKPESVPSLLQLAASLIFIPVMNNAGAYQPVLSVGWSLNYEFVFYILFAAVLNVKSDWKRLGLLLVPVSALVSLYYQFYLFEFLLGGLVFISHSWRISCSAPVGSRTSKKAVLLAWLAIISIAFFMLVTSRTVYSEGGLVRFFAWGVAGALLLYLMLGLPYIDTSNRTPTSFLKRGLSWLGEISYSLYLTHWIVGMTLHKLLASSSWNLPVALRISIVFLLSIVFGHVLHRHVEQPLDRWLRKRLLGDRFQAPVVYRR